MAASCRHAAMVEEQLATPRASGQFGTLPDALRDRCLRRQRLLAIRLGQYVGGEAVDHALSTRGCAARASKRGATPLRSDSLRPVF